MGYPQEGLRGNFFEPIMASAANDTHPLAAIDLSAAAGSHGEFLCMRACTLRQFEAGVVLTAVVATTTAPTIVFKKRPTPGSSSGQSTVATLIIPDATAIGKVLYKLVTPVPMAVGDSIEISWTQAVGSAAGKASVSWRADFAPEVEANNSDEIASA